MLHSRGHEQYGPCKRKVYFRRIGQGERRTGRDNPQEDVRIRRYCIHGQQIHPAFYPQVRCQRERLHFERL